ncbi:spore germination protein GerW family protein [Streptomyces sp. VNUA116]|uniref:spore germination protein GerW family protein n=1 Tax=Streptomyces sp. VNUA116 TaxID=3062449 RepID=UPI0026770848|nr:spore germination protein GerW family protein [Streptomyces sp. VNUA116]WKU42863.1 spore germination protein GerW family protein [Streptomyces sp. VNUA116]
MTAPEDTARPVPDENTPAAHVSAALLERLAGELGSRASKTIVYGEPVTTDGITVIPVAEVGIGFGFGGGAARTVGAATTGEGGGGGGVMARPRGFIEIKGGTAAYRPLRNPWVDVALPVAALLAGTAVPLLVRRLTKRRIG